jgi:hypothetical protein
MNKMKGWIVGLTIVSLLGVGVVAVAGNGFGKSTPRAAQQTAGTCSSVTCDGDCVRPLDGTGNGAATGYGQHLSATRPLDGTGYRAGQGCGQVRGAGGSSCAGSCG